MRRLLHTIVWALCLWASAPAQETEACWIDGIVVLSGDQPLVNAHIAIYAPGEQATRLRTITDANGYFSLRVPYGDYTLEASYLGQRQELRQDLRLRAERISLGKLLFRGEQMLQAVEVVAQAPIVRYEGSKMIFGSAAFAQAKGGNILDGIKLIPGLQLQQGTSLKLYGLSDVLVYIDGRALKMPAREVASYLQGMSIEEIESIELIREPGVEYGNVTSPILNIRRKPRGESGIKGFSQAGLTYQRYLSEQLSTRANLNFGSTRSFVHYTLGDTRRLETTTLLGATDTILTDARLGHQIAAGTDISLGRGGNLGGQLQATFLGERLKLGYQRSSKLTGRQLYGTLYHSLRRERWGLETTAEASVGRNEISYQALSASQRQERDRLYRLALDYNLQVASGLNLRLGAEGQLVALRSTPEASARTMHLDEWNVASYGSLRYRLNQVSGEVGLRLNRDHRKAGTSTGAQLDETHLRLLPFASVRINLNAHNAVALTLSSTYIRPNFRDLMDFSSETSALLVRQGNSHLKTSYRYSLSASYTYRRAASLELSYVDTRHPIVESISRLGSRYTLQRQNLDYSRYARVLLALPVPLISRKEFSWIASTYLAGQRQWDAGTVGLEAYRKAFNVYYVQHKHSLSLPGGWYIEGGITRYSALVYGLYSMRAQWWTDFSISRTIDDWRISLTLSDPFNTNKAYGEYALSGASISFQRNWHSPRVGLTIAYNWGRSALKATSRRNSLEDRKRLSTTANEGINTTITL